MTIESSARYTPEAIALCWEGGGDLWEQWRPQLEALGWANLAEDGPPRPPFDGRIDEG